MKYFAKYLKDENKNVTLFLCTHDIKVGDKFLHPIHRGLTAIKIEDGWVFSEESFGHNLDYMVKIVGKISPEAKWIKDGDKFTEYETWAYNQEKGFFYAKLPEGEEFHQDFLSKENPSIILKVKCPMCETFH